MDRLRHCSVKLFSPQGMSEVCANDNLSHGPINILQQNQFNKFDSNGKSACSYYATPKLPFSRYFGFLFTELLL